jgi:hypothetical protein
MVAHSFTRFLPRGRRFSPFASMNLLRAILITRLFFAPSGPDDPLIMFAHCAVSIVCGTTTLYACFVPSKTARFQWMIHGNKQAGVNEEGQAAEGQS